MENLINQSKRILKQQEISAWVAAMAAAILLGLLAGSFIFFLAIILKVIDA